MKEKLSFTEELNQLEKFQKLLANGTKYNLAYYLTFNEYHQDYLTDDFEISYPDKKIVGVIEGDCYSGIAPRCLGECSQVKK